LEPEHLEKLYAKMAEASAKPGTVHQVHRTAKAGRRTVGIPRPLLELLRKHKAAQDEERRFAGTAWQLGDWVFAQPTGRPLDPRADHDESKALLVEAQVRDARLHDAWHTAATMLLVLKIPLPAIMEIMGWSDAAVAKRYVHVPTEVVAGIADQVGDFLWNDGPRSPGPVSPAQPDAASLIDQLQRLLDTLTTSNRPDCARWSELVLRLVLRPKLRPKIPARAGILAFLLAK
jgi:hypothetical protein